MRAAASGIRPPRRAALGARGAAPAAAVGFDGAVLPSAVLRWLGAVTALGVVFPAGYTVEAAARPGYDWVAEPMSALALGPGGWAQRLDFVSFGALMLVSAFVWRRALAPGRSALALPLGKAAAGIGLIGCGIFSQDPTEDYHPGGPVPLHASLHGQLHLLFSFVAISATAACALALARRLSAEPRWGRPWAAYAAATGAATVVLIAAFGTLGAHGGAAGLLERGATAIDTLLGVLVVARLIAQSRIRPAGGA